MIAQGDAYCPLVTPFDDEGALDVDAMADLVEHLVDAGIDGLVPCGTTGEFATLTGAERRRAVVTTVEAADGRVPVIAGAGGTAVESIREDLRAADEAGADAGLVVAPYYGGQASDAGNEAFFRAVADDAPLPVYLYNIPSAAGQRLTPDVVAALADHDRIAGIKDSSGDLTALDEILARTPAEFDVLQGWDSGFVPALVMGADGGINALTHLFPEAFADAADAVESGDLDRARRRQLETIDAPFRACVDQGFAPAIKAVLADRGVLPSAAVRPPREPLSDDACRALLDRVADGAATSR